jgi:hypothetical protein
MSTYIFEKYSVSQQKNEYGIKKIITTFKTTTTSNLVASNNIIPIWELNSDDITHTNTDKTDTTVVIGKVVIKITYGGDQDNESLTKMLRLVGTNTNTPTASMLTTTYTALANTIYGGTGLDTDSELYKSTFYIGGQNSSSTKIKTFTKIIDMNRPFSSNKYFGLGLQINSAPPAGTTLTIDTYVEVILVD